MQEKAEPQQGSSPARFPCIPLFEGIRGMNRKNHERSLRVLVAGATGYLGQYIAKSSKKQGYYTAALVRNTAKKAAGRNDDHRYPAFIMAHNSRLSVSARQTRLLCRLRFPRGKTRCRRRKMPLTRPATSARSCSSGRFRISPNRPSVL